MAVVHRLPNGYLVITLTPREGTLFCDEILDPGDFPWQRSESQLIAVEVKSQIKSAIEHEAAARIDMIGRMVEEKAVRSQEEEE